MRRERSVDPGGQPGVRPGQPALPVVQTDVANTSIAALALLRAGYTPAKGAHSRHLTKAITYVLGELEKADKESMVVTSGGGRRNSALILLWACSRLIPS